MDISATEFAKRAATTAEHFGFQTADLAAAHLECKECTERIKHTASAADRKNDGLHGLLAGGISTYTDNKLHARTHPTLIYNLEPVPRSGDTALTLQIFGTTKSIAEAILIQTTRALVQDLGYNNHTVRINSIGDKESVARYTRELGNFMRKRIEDIPSSARELMKEHVFTALQHLIEKEHEFAHRSPNPMEYLSDPSRKHFRDIVEFLDMSGTPYEIDVKLIGHHQCYSDALFTIDMLDDDDVVIKNSPLYVRGGRYNTFMHTHLGEDHAAAGAVVVLKDKPAPKRTVKGDLPTNNIVSVVQIGFGPKIKSLMLIDELRRAGIAVQQDLAVDSLSTQLRNAEAAGVKYVLLIGQKEFVDGTVILRDMNARTQEAIPADQIVSRLKRFAAVQVA